MPPLSPENIRRRETEALLRSLVALDLVVIWGQENMTSEERCDYWRTHAEDLKKLSAWHYQIATEYPTNKAKEADEWAELFRRTDAMYPS